MKKILALLMALTLLVLCFCGSAAFAADDAAAEDAEETEEEEEEKPYGPLSFTYNEVSFGILDEAEPVMEALGEADDLFVSASCAYQGDDYIYYYDGLELTTNEIDGVFCITGIVLADDTIKTPQGLTIGMDIEEALKLMDEIDDEDLTMEENRGVYSFQYGPALLMVKADANGEITAIQYSAVTED